MSDNKNPNQKQPGEKKAGMKYHHNPGNQSGKTVDIGKPDPIPNNKTIETGYEAATRNKVRPTGPSFARSGADRNSMRPADSTRRA